MDNQHRVIEGYREVTHLEVSLVNQVKSIEAHWNGLIDRLRKVENIDRRQLSIAVTDGEAAFMRAVRAIMRPERKVLDE